MNSIIISNGAQCNDVKLFLQVVYHTAQAMSCSGIFNQTGTCSYSVYGLPVFIERNAHIAHACTEKHKLPFWMCFTRVDLNEIE